MTAKNIKCNLVFLSILYSRKRKSITLKRFSVMEHPDKKSAMGHAYSRHQCSYMNSDREQTILWTGNPSYGTCLYEIAFITNGAGSGIDLSDKHQVRKLRDLFNEMYEDWTSYKGKKKWEDQSLRLSRYAWQTTIPKGYKLLRVGSIIRDDDMEYSDTSYYGHFWGSISHYNVGKKVKKGYGMTVISDGKKTKHKGENNPLIIRKIK